MYEVVEAGALNGSAFDVRAIDCGNGIYHLVMRTSVGGQNIATIGEIVFAYGLSIFRANNPRLKVVYAFLVTDSLIVVTEPK